ncbi:unnamed protein product [Enterobius vermicularis]|uniref:Uncharacterized protein n=1 Tax=Enterobius vermicularis TaxID=51028 RepID=A0A0N4VBL1_ENTVE|nr:unnamed protein product [Enterobius vermicularis]
MERLGAERQQKEVFPLQQYSDSTCEPLPAFSSLSACGPSFASALNMSAILVQRRMVQFCLEKQKALQSLDSCNEPSPVPTLPDICGGKFRVPVRSLKFASHNPLLEKVAEWLIVF